MIKWSTKDCFKHYDEVLPFLPACYLNNCDSEESSWFTSSPSFTTVRVNTLLFNVQDVLESIKTQFSEDSNGDHMPNSPLVYQHDVLKECIIVGPWRNCKNMHRNEWNEVIVDVPCGNAVLRGADVFAPGVMGMQSWVKEGHSVDIYVDIGGNCRKGYKKKFEGKKLFIGSGIAHVNRNQLFENNNQPKGIAVKVTYRLSNIPSFTIPKGAGLLQNLPSILCSFILDVTPEHCVLDMCAAPGNKTTHIASLMKNKGTLIALDKTEPKVEQIKSLCKNLGISNVRAFAWDSTKVVDENKMINDLHPPFPICSFDRILLDGPCSGLGQRPALRNSISAKQIKSNPVVQKKLFTNAVALLKHGGILVYSTCTITTEENEKMVAWGLDKFPDLRLCDSSPFLGSPGLPESGLTSEQRSCVQRFGHQEGNTPETDTIGFFIAKFIKI